MDAFSGISTWRAAAEPVTITPAERPPAQGGRSSKGTKLKSSGIISIHIVGTNIKGKIRNVAGIRIPGAGRNFAISCAGSASHGRWSEKRAFTPQQWAVGACSPEGHGPPSPAVGGFS